MTALIKENHNNQFEALFQHASIGIIVVDAHAEITNANSFLLSLFGYNSQDELIGKKIEELIPTRYHKNHSTYRDNYHKKPEPRPMGLGRDLFGMKKDGTEIPVEISLSNYSTSEGNFTIAFVSDISKRKAIELSVVQQKEELALINKKIEELNNELEQKVESRTKELQQTMQLLQASKDELTKSLNKEKELSDLKSRFVSMASHEFRTPLSTILSSASLVSKYTETVDQEKRDKHIHRIKSSVNNLTDILNEFLSIGKIEDGKIVAHFADFDIVENIESVCNEMQSHVKGEQKIIYKHDGDKIVHLDPSLLRNIVINLLSNAIKFSNSNGKIFVQSIVNPKSIILSIKDSGIGISKEDQEHLFERFFRAANATNIQGTGLGLHIVGKYVELMNGHIDFISELEKGTEFIIKFNNE
ncbi:MAG: PAS domain S-box protein [Chitinophagaceae bacterium]|nr:PAS domain S-box protein [Chitinophagaceae bacterium]